MEAEVNTLLPLVQLAWCYLKNEEEKTQHKTKQNNNTHTQITQQQNKKQEKEEPTDKNTYSPPLCPLSAPSSPQKNWDR